MASRFVNFLCLVFVCSLIVGGNCQPCTLDNLEIAQGKISDDKWNVTITNDCPCSQLDVKLSCDGFDQSAVDPSILSKSGGECLVNNGQPIYGNKIFNFAYASKTEFPFKPLSSQVACSNERCLEKD
nr:uncharacterized protein At1g05835-like [Malus domestica]